VVLVVPAMAALAAAVAMVAAIMRRRGIFSRRGASRRGHGCGTHRWDRRRETRQQDRSYRGAQKLCHAFHVSISCEKSITCLHWSTWGQDCLARKSQVLTGCSTVQVEV